MTGRKGTRKTEGRRSVETLLVMVVFGELESQQEGKLMVGNPTEAVARKPVRTLPNNNFGLWHCSND